MLHIAVKWLEMFKSLCITYQFNYEVEMCQNLSVLAIYAKEIVKTLKMYVHLLDMCNLWFIENYWQCMMVYQGIYILLPTHHPPYLSVSFPTQLNAETGLSNAWQSTMHELQQRDYVKFFLLMKKQTQLSMYNLHSFVPTFGDT